MVPCESSLFTFLRLLLYNDDDRVNDGDDHGGENETDRKADDGDEILTRFPFFSFFFPCNFPTCN